MIKVWQRLLQFVQSRPNVSRATRRLPRATMECLESRHMLSAASAANPRTIEYDLESALHVPGYTVTIGGAAGTEGRVGQWILHTVKEQGTVDPARSIVVDFGEGIPLPSGIRLSDLFPNGPPWQNGWLQFPSNGGQAIDAGGLIDVSTGYGPKFEPYENGEEHYGEHYGNEHVVHDIRELLSALQYHPQKQQAEPTSETAASVVAPATPAANLSTVVTTVKVAAPAVTDAPVVGAREQFTPPVVESTKTDDQSGPAVVPSTQPELRDEVFDRAETKASPDAESASATTAAVQSHTAMPQDEVEGGLVALQRDAVSEDASLPEPTVDANVESLRDLPVEMDSAYGKFQAFEVSSGERIDAVEEPDAPVTAKDVLTNPSLGAVAVGTLFFASLAQAKPAVHPKDRKPRHAQG